MKHNTGNVSKQIRISSINRYRCVTALVLFLFLHGTSAVILEIPLEGNLVGEVEYASPEPGETLSEVGLRYDIGYEEMVKANPGIDQTHPLSQQLRLLIPSRFTLPSGPRHGLVIQKSAYRLFYFPETEDLVMTYPVGIGRKGWETPLGKTSIIAKQTNPTWRPSAHLQEEALKNGQMLPAEFPSNKENPLGQQVLRLGWPTYLIHGSPHPEGIGRPISAGCIRMLEEDMASLFSEVHVGTSVRVEK